MWCQIISKLSSKLISTNGKNLKYSAPVLFIMDLLYMDPRFWGSKDFDFCFVLTKLFEVYRLRKYLNISEIMFDSVVIYGFQDSVPWTETATMQSSKIESVL